MTSSYLPDNLAALSLHVLAVASYMYPSLDLAREGITKMGNLLADVGTPRELGPQIFCFAGLGAVGKGT